MLFNMAEAAMAERETIFSFRMPVQGDLLKRN